MWKTIGRVIALALLTGFAVTCVSESILYIIRLERRVAALEART